MKYQLATAALAALFLAAALAAGAHRKGALLGAAISGATALGSILAMARFSRAGKKPVQSALAVMVAAFLLRIVLVAIGTFVVIRAGESVVGFVAAFFLPYFVFAAVEGAFVHSLSQGSGPTA